MICALNRSNATSKWLKQPMAHRVIDMPDEKLIAIPSSTTKCGNCRGKNGEWED